MNAAAAVVRNRLIDARDAITSMPDRATWRRCFRIYAVFVVLTLPLGYGFGLVQLRLAAISARASLGLLIGLAVHPAFGEELLFRALLLPRPPRQLPVFWRLTIAVVALAAYLAAHPLNAWLFRPGVWGLFTSPGYLACAALLGATCTAAYWISASIWPPFLLHWMTAAVWILCLGGQQLLAQ